MNSKSARFPSVSWLGLIHSVEGLKCRAGVSSVKKNFLLLTAAPSHG